MVSDFIYSKIHSLLVIELHRRGQFLLFLVLILLVMLVNYFHIKLGVDYRFNLVFMAFVAIGTWYTNRFYSTLGIVIISSRWIHWTINAESQFYREAAHWNGASEFLLLILFSELIRIVHIYFKQNYHVSHTDHLTGLLNLRGVSSAAEPVLALSKREQHWNSLVYFDIDNFKEVNDNLGHDMGDRVLQQVAHYLKMHLRHSDISARVGGDEFLVVMPNTSPEESKKLIKKIDQELIQW